MSGISLPGAGLYVRRMSSPGFSSRVRKARLLLFAAVAISLAACATLGLPELRPLRFAEAEERTSELRLELPSSDRPAGGAALRLWAEVENPNPFGLTLSEIEGRLHLEGAEGPRVRFPLGLPLEAGQDTVIPLDVSIGFQELPELASALRAAVVRGAADYRLEGTFVVEAGRLGAPSFGPMTLLEGEVRARP